MSASSQASTQKVLVFDFGAQYGQLIARRVRDLHVYSEIVPCDITAEEARLLRAQGRRPGADAVLTPLAKEIMEGSV